MSDLLSHDDDWNVLLASARSGSSHALGELLERYRADLYAIVHGNLAARIRSKHGPSDLVQQSFLEAHRDFHAFQGATSQELLSWLRHILENNLLDFARRYQETAKRDLSREQSNDLAEAMHAVPSRDPSPSQYASTREQIVLLQEVLMGLDEEKQRVLRLRHQEQLTFVEIGRHMDRSEEAARKLWGRAVEELRHRLKEGGSGTQGSD